MRFRMKESAKTSIQDYLNPGLQAAWHSESGLAQSTCRKWNVFFALIQDQFDPRLIADPDLAIW